MYLFRWTTTTQIFTFRDKKERMDLILTFLKSNQTNFTATLSNGSWTSLSLPSVHVKLCLKDIYSSSLWGSSFDSGFAVVAIGHICVPSQRWPFPFHPLLWTRDTNWNHYWPFETRQVWAREKNKRVAANRWLPLIFPLKFVTNHPLQQHPSSSSSPTFRPPSSKGFPFSSPSKRFLPSSHRLDTQN